MSDRDSKVMFESFELTRGGFCATLKAFDPAAKKIKQLRTDDCAVHDRIVYPSPELVTERKD